MAIKYNEITRSKDIRYSPSQINLERVEIRNRAILRLVRVALGDRISEVRNKRILDLACGRGELLRLLVNEGYKTFGMDLDPVCIDFSRRYTQCTQGNALSVDDVFENGAFDLVVCSHFVEHTENPKLVVEKIKNVSKRFIILAVPNLAQPVTLNYRAPKYVNPGHLCGWDPPHLKTFLELHCGLTIMKWECDQVILPGRALGTRFRSVRPLTRWLEVQVLPKLFPYFSNSLLVLCEIN